MKNERKQTLRQEIISLLERDPMTVRELSQAVGIMEKDVTRHLESIDKTVKHRKQKLDVSPFFCRNCGFEFKSRKRLKKPGKCPACRDGRIEPAVFRIR
ncbi:MAG: ArsR family transcriptional regulator [Desulfobacteraceae bacterium]